MGGSRVIIRYVIEVVYPPSVTEEDAREYLDELVDTMSRYGLGADGWLEEVVE